MEIALLPSKVVGDLLILSGIIIVIDRRCISHAWVTGWRLLQADKGSEKGGFSSYHRFKGYAYRSSYQAWVALIQFIGQMASPRPA